MTRSTQTLDNYHRNVDDEQFDSDSEVIIKRPCAEELQKQEEKEMQKFIDFMKKNGMVMVQTTPAVQTSQVTAVAMQNNNPKQKYWRNK